MDVVGEDGSFLFERSEINRLQRRGEELRKERSKNLSLDVKSGTDKRT